MERTSLKLAVFIFGLIFITACSLPDGGSPPHPTETTESENSIQTVITEESTVVSTIASDETIPVAVTGSCANAYYPVREGSTWTYQSTSTITAPYTFTDTITSLYDGGFTLTSQYDGLTRTQEWTCAPQGLMALQMSGGSGTLTTGETNLILDTQNASGVTYPAEINAGDIWQYILDFTGTMNIAGQSADATGNTQTNFTALGKENITVPAGTFDAMKIQVDTTLNITATFQGATLPINVSGTTTSWFAEGVGWIKSVSTGDMGETSSSETIELQWYNIP